MNLQSIEIVMSSYENTFWHNDFFGDNICSWNTLPQWLAFLNCINNIFLRIKFMSSSIMVNNKESIKLTQWVSRISIIYVSQSRKFHWILFKLLYIGNYFKFDNFPTKMVTKNTHLLFPFLIFSKHLWM